MDENYSYHIFMFPFRFDYIKKSFIDKHDYYKDYDFDERVKIDKSFKHNLEKDGWEYQKFEVKKHTDYNEIAYFYDFVRDSLYNIQDFEDSATSYYFKKKRVDNRFYKIKIKDKKIYELIIDNISLRIFDTGVGILSFELKNEKYRDFDDILKINEYGRRIYPQFLGKNFDVQDTKKAFLPDFLEVCGIKEDFSKRYEKPEPASFILKILGENSFTINNEDENSKGKNFIQPIIDDRMFVICWYENSSISSILKGDNWKESDKWYKYVFVDGNDITVQDKDMQKELIEKATYKRWNYYGTFYGITRYSFVSLTNDDYFGKNIIQAHMKTIYFQIVTLLLAQRASILRFSDEITAISNISNKDSSSDKKISEKISILYKNFLRFSNKLYFKEVTAQEQGIEMYDQGSQMMNIKRDIDDLKQEISSLNSYAFVLQEKEERVQMNNLTKLGTIFLPGTFIAGIFGMNVFPDNTINNYFWLISSLILILFITLWLGWVHNIEICKFLGCNLAGREFLNFVKSKKEKNEQI